MFLEQIYWQKFLPYFKDTSKIDLFLNIFCKIRDRDRDIAIKFQPGSSISPKNIAPSKNITFQENISRIRPVALSTAYTIYKPTRRKLQACYKSIFLSTTKFKQHVSLIWYLSLELYSRRKLASSTARAHQDKPFAFMVCPKQKSCLDSTQ